MKTWLLVAGQILPHGTHKKLALPLMIRMLMIDMMEVRVGNRDRQPEGVMAISKRFRPHFSGYVFVCNQFRGEHVLDVKVYVII